MGSQPKKVDLSPLLDWFERIKRDLPWRTQRTPYSVWVSEVMLQQTRVDVVVPYYLRWMELFPSLGVLARAPREAVIKAWEGLGYYSRARNLHDGAKQVVEEFAGILPSAQEALLRIKGIGPYTAGAICSFAFGQRVPAVDTNVLRVCSRLLDHPERVSSAKTRKLFEIQLSSWLPEEHPQIFMEALIELGALICSKKPHCGGCPLQRSCLSYKRGTVSIRPVEEKRACTTLLERFVALVLCEGHCLVRKQQGGELFHDLHEFPFTECSKWREFAHWRENLEVLWSLRLQEQEALQLVEHSFTRFRAKLFPRILRSNDAKEVEGFFWHPTHRLQELSFNAGHRKIARMLQGA